MNAKLIQPTYNKLINQTPDIEARYLDKVVEGYPTVIQNKLPIDVYVFLENRNTGNFWININPLGPSITTFIGIIKPHSSITIPYNASQDNDILHFKYDVNFVDRSVHNPTKTFSQTIDPALERASNSKIILSNSGEIPQNLSFVCPSIDVVKRFGNIIIGGIVSFTKTFKRDIHPGGDISSINIHNMLPWPLNIYMDGKKVMVIDRNHDLGTIHHGDLTQSPVVYFDNWNRGLNIGTRFDIYIIRNDLKESINPLYLSTFVISDTNQDHIFIGQPSNQIDDSSITGANTRNAIINGTGQAIYRIGDINPLNKSMIYNKVEGINTNNRKYMITEATSIGVMPKNYNPSNKYRTPMDNRSSHGTVPTARYGMLSGNNMIQMGVKLSK